MMSGDARLSRRDLFPIPVEAGADDARLSRRDLFPIPSSRPRTGSDPAPIPLQHPNPSQSPLLDLVAGDIGPMASGIGEQLGWMGQGAIEAVVDPFKQGRKISIQEAMTMPGLSPGPALGTDPAQISLHEGNPILPPGSIPPKSPESRGYGLGANLGEGYEQFSKELFLGGGSKLAGLGALLLEAPDRLSDRGVIGQDFPVGPGRFMRQAADTIQGAIPEPQTFGGNVGRTGAGLSRFIAAGAVGGPAGLAGMMGGESLGGTYTSTVRALMAQGVPEQEAILTAMKTAGATAPIETAINMAPQGRLIESVLGQGVRRSALRSIAGDVGFNAVAGAGTDAVHQAGQIAAGAQERYDPTQTLRAAGENAAAAGVISGGSRFIRGASDRLANQSSRFAEPSQPPPQPAATVDTPPPSAPPVTPTEPTIPARPVEPPKAESDFAPRPPMQRPAAEGRSSTLLLADGNDRPVRYDVIDARDLITTHRPEENFAPDPAGDSNERAYHDITEGKASRDRVHEIATTMKPDLVLTNTPTATDGPPITTSDYRVLGGNARAMGIKLAYSRGLESSAAYRKSLSEQAAAFGVDPAKLAGIEQPILVRRMEGANGKRGELSRILNESLTTGKSADTDTVSRGLQLKQSHTDAIANLMGERTLREVLSDSKDSARVVQQLVDSGAFVPSDLVKFQEADGRLNDAGKDAIENTLLGAAVGDVRSLNQATPGMRNKLLRALPAITRLRAGKFKDFNFQDTLANSLDVLHDLRQSGYKSIADLVDQTSMIKETWRDDPRAIQLARSMLDDSPTKFATKLRDVAAIADQTSGGQGGFDFGQPRTIHDAFDEIFAIEPTASADPGLFGQETKGISGKQQELPLEIMKRDDWRARKKGETNDEYRMRLRWGSPEQLKNTPPLFEDQNPGVRPAGAPVAGNSASSPSTMMGGGGRGAPPLRGRTVTPAEKSVAQTAANRPAAVKQDIDRMRSRMREDIETEKDDRTTGTGRYDKEVDVRAEAMKERSELMRPQSFRSIINDLYESLHLGGPTAPVERSKRGKALGRIFMLRQDIKLNRADNISTAAHEAGHFLHELLFPDLVKNLQKGRTKFSRKRYGDTFPKAWMPELEAMGKALYGNKKPDIGYAGEGWAEYTKKLVMDPVALKKQAPTVYREVTKMLATEHPDVWRALLRTRVAMKFNEQAGNEVAAYVFDFNAKMPKGMQETVSELKNKYLDSLGDTKSGFRTAFVDRYDRAADFNKDLALKMPADRDPHITALRTSGKIRGWVRNLVESGPWEPGDPTHTPKMPGLAEILRPIKDNLDEWQQYMIAKRAIEKRAQGFGGTLGQVTDEYLAEVVKKGESTSGFKKAADQFQQMNEWLIRDFAVYHDLIKPEQAEKIIEKNQHYITFQLVDPDGSTDNAMRKSSSKFSNKTSGIRRFRVGDGEEILPPLGPFMQSMQTIVSNAQKNAAARTITDHFDRFTVGSGRWLAQADIPLEAKKLKDATFTKAVGGHLRETLEGMGVGKDEIDSQIEALGNLTSPTDFFETMKHDPRTRTISVLKDGKRKYYKVVDRRLFELLEGLTEPAAMSPWVQLLHLPSNLLRAGATTLNPDFFIGNLVKDTFQALTMTETDYREIGSTAARRLRGMAAAWKSGDVERMWNAGGGDMGSMFGMYLDKNGRIDESKLFESKTLLGKIKNDGMKAVIQDLATAGPVRRINESLERMTRFGEMEAVREGRTDSASIAKAVQAGADITLDFSRGGTNAKEWNRATAFFNASIQGTDKAYRFFRQHPIKALGRVVATAMVPSMISMLMNQNNEDYWSKGVKLRDQYFWYPIGHDQLGRMRYLRMPKPHVIGLFASATERMYARAFGRDPLTGERGGDPQAFRGFSQTAASQLLPPDQISALAPLVEVNAGPQGWSFYFDRPIVPNSDRDLPAEEQGAANSTQLARSIGRLLEMSPAKVDHVIRGYLGGAGANAAQAVSKVIPDDGRQGAKAPTRFGDYIIVRRFLAGSTRGDHEALRRFFDDYDEAKGYRKAAMEREGEAQQEYIKNHRQAIEKYDSLQKTYTTLQKIWKAKRETLKDESIDGDALDKRLHELDQKAIELIRETYKSAKSGDNKP